MKKWERILFGGDYNPNQWPREIWKEDMRLFKKAGSTALLSCVLLGQVAAFGRNLRFFGTGRHYRDAQPGKL